MTGRRRSTDSVIKFQHWGPTTLLALTWALTVYLAFTVPTPFVVATALFLPPVIIAAVRSDIESIRLAREIRRDHMLREASARPVQEAR